MERQRLELLLRSQQTNAVVAWVVIVAVALAAVAGVVAGRFLWGGFAVAVGALVLLPPIAHRDATVMLPWEIILLTALPVLGRTYATVPVTGQIATYLSVAALALVVAVELHLFTPVRMNVPFAIAFVVVATLATAGFWAVARWLADVYLGTAFFHDPALTPIQTEHQLMWEFVASTVAGLLGGVVFEFYVRRRARTTARLPGGEKP
ncbi:MAG: hypothetical protein ABEI96_02745 [Haloarculaceae archaeon]